MYASTVVNNDIMIARQAYVNQASYQAPILSPQLLNPLWRHFGMGKNSTSKLRSIIVIQAWL
jgi:hypothetical protein